MLPCCCSLPSSSTSVNKFISDHPYLTMLENLCTTMKDLKIIHVQLIKTGLIKDKIAASRILAFCASSAGDINYAHLVFSRIQRPNLYAWNTIIRGFAQSSTPENAIALFIDMLYSPIQPQHLTYPSVFKAYAQLGIAHDGAQLHGRTVKLGLDSDQFIQNTIIHMYASGGLLCEAQAMFHEHKEFDVVAWNSMIMGLAKCGEIDESKRLFDKMPSSSTVTWNSMISGYVRNGKLVEALELFHKMQEARIEPTEFTMVSLLNACAHLGALKQGEWIHDYIRKTDFDLNIVGITAIIDMYCKCGAVEKARQVFESSPRKGLSCWNSMILGLAMNGGEKEAIQLFSELKTSNLMPDSISFIGVLTACQHLGFVDKAKSYFSLMATKYKITPSLKHYTCMVGVLGQAGLVEEAEGLIRRLPVEPDAIIWGYLLSACRKHGNLEIAKLAARQINDSDPRESCGYVLMSNIHSAFGRFEDALSERFFMRQKLIEKETGCSLIEVNGGVHEFIAGGRNHQEIQEIYSLLNGMQQVLKETD